MYYKVEGKDMNTLFESTSKAEAVAYFKKHSKSNFIQRFTRKGGATNGTFQPTIPNFVMHKGKKYTKAYLGFTTKTQADRFVNPTSDWDKRSKLKMIKRKFKYGYMLYARLEK